MFVKIGLVLLGTSVIFADILKAGSLGLIQALAVVLSVWYFADWLCKKLKVDDELTMMINSAVSICGVSAVIATSGAIKGDPNFLHYFSCIDYSYSDDDRYALRGKIHGSDTGNYRCLAGVEVLTQQEP